MLKRLKRLMYLIVFLALLAGVAAYAAIERASIPPRSLSPYIVHRADGHSDKIMALGGWLSGYLMQADRGSNPISLDETRLRVGAHPDGIVDTTAHAANLGQLIEVHSASELLAAVAQAKAGDQILIAPGTYHVRGDGGYILAKEPGTENSPITVKAERLGTVVLEFEMGEGFLVTAPYWTFENLSIKGVCKEHSFCEHAFHVVGGGSHFVSRNNIVVDFNAQYKINGDGTSMPDFGLIEHNSLFNTSVRRTANPITMVDLVAASHWTIRANYFGDFVKGEGDNISYGAFAKGAGNNNVFEQNVVICENHLAGVPGSRVGLSLGGGGTGLPYCRDKRCITEQDGSSLRSNLIAACSDDGIYINRSATSQVLHNTLIDTGGISVRFVESSADVHGNLVDGVIRTRDGGILRGADNIETDAARLYLGAHPVRDMFRSVSSFDLHWQAQGPGPAMSWGKLPDLCVESGANLSAYGAFNDFTNCMR